MNLKQKKRQNKLYPYRFTILAGIFICLIPQHHWRSDPDTIKKIPLNDMQHGLQLYLFLPITWPSRKWSRNDAFWMLIMPHRPQVRVWSVPSVSTSFSAQDRKHRFRCLHQARPLHFVCSASFNDRLSMSISQLPVLDYWFWPVLRSRSRSEPRFFNWSRSPF